MTTEATPSIEELNPGLKDLGRYEYGWHDADNAGASAQRGLSPAVVEDISVRKSEPEWMRTLRLKSLTLFDKKPMPSWGSDLTGIDFQNIKFFVRSTEKQATSWDELPEDIKNTYDKLGIPEAEKQRLIAGVAAQYESEVVYHQIREDLEEKGVIFVDTDTGLREHEDLFREYFGTVIPAGDNKFAALNTAVWSGGSFIYVPPGVHVDIPLQAYFRINTENMGQFERTLIIADEGSYVHYVEGCTAPIYKTDSLHSAVVEIVVKKNARVRYTTIQNWSNNVYNLVTKRATCEEGATMEWIDGNIGSKVTMKYPAVFLMGEHAKGETLSIALLGTTLAALLALPVSLLAARNIIPSNLIRFPVRRFLDSIRGVDTLIWALVFGWLVFGDWPSSAMLFGSALIIAAVGKSGPGMCVIKSSMVIDGS